MRLSAAFGYPDTLYRRVPLGGRADEGDATACSPGPVNDMSLRKRIDACRTLKPV